MFGWIVDDGYKYDEDLIRQELHPVWTESSQVRGLKSG